jgi:hypothetical protein
VTEYSGESPGKISSTTSEEAGGALNTDTESSAASYFTSEAASILDQNAKALKNSGAGEPMSTGRVKREAEGPSSAYT